MTAKTALMRWRAQNLTVALPRRVRPSPPLASLADALHRDGVTSSDVETVFGADPVVRQALERALELREKHGPPSGDRPQDFIAHLLGEEIDGDDPFLALAAHPNALSIVNHYLGLRSRIRALDVWLTIPTEGPSVNTQLWHRDGDDVMNVKMYVYFSDVTVASGPLAYAVGTHPVGRNKAEPTAKDRDGRSGDADMANVLRQGQRLCEGPAGTVFFADTCGYHKQLKPSAGERLLLMVQYTSPKPRFPMAYRLASNPPAPLTRVQRAALGID